MWFASFCFQTVDGILWGAFISYLKYARGLTCRRVTAIKNTFSIILDARRTIQSISVRKCCFISDCKAEFAYKFKGLEAHSHSLCFLVQSATFSETLLRVEEIREFLTDSEGLFFTLAYRFSNRQRRWFTKDVR